MSFLFQDGWNDELIDTIFEIVEQGTLAAEVSGVSGLKRLQPSLFNFIFSVCLQKLLCRSWFRKEKYFFAC